MEKKSYFTLPRTSCPKNPFWSRERSEVSLPEPEPGNSILACFLRIVIVHYFWDYPTLIWSILTMLIYTVCSSFFWQKISSEERSREWENLIQSSILDVCDLSNAILCVFLCPHMLKSSLENSWLKWRKEGEKAPKRQQHKNLVKEKPFSQVYSYIWRLLIKKLTTSKRCFLGKEHFPNNPYFVQIRFIYKSQNVNFGL